LAYLDASLSLRSVELQSLLRGPDSQVTWLKISTITVRHGGTIPRILILDGRAIGLLVILRGSHILLTERPRVATGNFLSEIPVVPAGGRDPSPELASELLLHETGLRVEPGGFVNLLGAVLGNDAEAIHPYCGPCDRQVFVFAAELDIDPAEIDGKELAPNVHARVSPIDGVGQTVSDFLSLSILLFYRKYKQR
jgi:hypothetical protein